MIRTACVLSLLLLACGSKPPPPADPPKIASDEDIADLKVRACECKDEACRAAVVADAKSYFIMLDQAEAMMSAAHACENQGALDELAAMRDSACQCKDVDCVETVHTAFDAWTKKYADIQGTPEEAEQAGKIVSEIDECAQKAIGDSGGYDGDDEEDE